MGTHIPLSTLRTSLAMVYAVRDVALRRLSQPLEPAVRQMERDHLDALEQAILDAEGRIARLERG